MKPSLPCKNPGQVVPHRFEMDTQGEKKGGGGKEVGFDDQESVTHNNASAQRATIKPEALKTRRHRASRGTNKDVINRRPWFDRLSDLPPTLKLVY